jgi:hypothetical protein
MADIQFINRTSLFQITMFRKLLASAKHAYIVVMTTCGNIHVDKDKVQAHADSSAALRNTTRSGGPWHKFSCDKEERRLIMASGKIRH